MVFNADKQTLKDLNILGKYDPASIYCLFNRVCTAGGERLLDEMLRHPLTAHEAINTRAAMFRYFTAKKVKLPFNAGDFRIAEQYLFSGDEGMGLHFFLIQALRRAVLKKMGLQEEYHAVRNGMEAMVKVVREFVSFIQELQEDPGQPFYLECQQFLADNQLQSLLKELCADRLDTRAFWRQVSIDYSFRGKLYEMFKQLFDLIYRIDVAVALGAVARERDFIYALALPASDAVLEIKNCRHPALPGAIGNDLHFSINENVLFLTGANMAGKSTLMKSVGVAVYLAHMGFPIAATSMVFSVKKGIFSSINVADDLNQGISHFYAEVLRVKEVAASVCAGNDLLVIFDELFKGTNVKDAFDATLEVTKAFALFRACNFIISTHIIEVGEELQQVCGNVKYGYMPTIIKGNVPTYTYRMKEGITSDRQGMMIIENEGILEMIK